MKNPGRQILCDTLIIGGGGAGLAAAAAAARAGAQVIVVSKEKCGQSGATYYNIAEVGAYNAPDGVGDPTDQAESFYEDIQQASLGMALPELSRIIAEHSLETLEYIAAMPGGDKIFEKAEGKYKVFQSCFTSKPRAHYMHDHFRPLLKVLENEAGRLRVKMLDGITIAELFVKDGVCYGALGFLPEGGEIFFSAKSVILAAGGASRLFRRNMYPRDITGDSYAMAYRAGAKMANLEFIQMGIGVAGPFINLFENYLWECYPALYNGCGKSFLEAYLPEGLSARQVLREKRLHFPFSVRDSSSYIEIAVQKEINAGRGNKNGNMELSMDTPEFKELLKTENNFSLMWQTTWDWYQKKGVDLLKGPMEIACFAHAINGGALIDCHGMTSVEGLYAVGEAAAGPHGADRLGGNMSVASQVFGRIAGEHSAQRAEVHRQMPEGQAFIKECMEFWSSLSLPAGSSANDVTELIQKETDLSLLIVRNESQLSNYKSTLQKLMSDCQKGEGDKISKKNMVSMYNLMETGGLIAEAALHRRESRGSHYREDYPKMDEAYNKPYILKKNQSDRL